MTTNSFFNSAGGSIADHTDPFVNPPFINAMRPPTAQDLLYPGTRWMDSSASPKVIYETTGDGTWLDGGNSMATTTEPGIVEIDLVVDGADTDVTVPTSKAVFDYGQTLVIAGANVASEVTAGIGQLATDAEAIAGTPSTPALALLVTPSNLAPFLAATALPASFTDLTATGTVSFTGATGAYTITSATASSVGTTGAGIDLTLASAAGRVIVNGEEAAANAITLVSAAGGIDVDAALQINIASSQNAVDAIRIVSSAGGIDIDAVGAATEDINITNTGGSIVISATENIADAIVISSTAGGIDITAAGAATEDIDITNTAGSIKLTSGEAVSDSMVFASSGGIDADAVGQVNIASSQNAADAIVIISSAGGVDITATGAAGEDLDLLASGSSVNVTATEDAAEAIYLRANGGVSETIRIHADQGTGVASINIGSDVGGITIAGGLGTADAVNITASTAGGGIDIDSSTGGFIVDTTGAFSIDGAAASNVTVTGAGIDLTLASVLGSVLVSSTEDAALAIMLHANGGTSETIRVRSDQGTGAASIDVLSDVGGITLSAGLGTADAINLVTSNAAGGIDIDAGTGGIAIDTTGAFSIDGAAASNVTTTGAGIDLTLSSVLGSVLVSSTEDAALAIRLYANGGTSETIQIHADQGTGVASIGLLSDDGGITLAATAFASADAINIAAGAGGIDMDSALQTVITSSQAAATAIQLTTSDAAGGITMTAGTGAVNVAGNLKLSSVATQIYMNGGAATDFIGTATLIAGQAVVLNTNIAAGDRIMITRTALNASPALGFLIYTISAGVSFTVDSYSEAGAAAVTDISSFSYVIVRQT